MKTLVLNPDDEAFGLATSLIRGGEIVGIPTETVYGLAADAFNEQAVAKIFAAKGRPQDNPLIVHVADVSQVSVAAREASPLAIRLFERFSPGPLTIVLPKRDIIPSVTSGGLDTVAVRIPDNENALRLIRESGCAIAAPSANTSGKPSPTTAAHVFADMEGKIPLIIDGGACRVGVESTVIAVNGGIISILRPGAITAEMLSEFAEVEVDKAVLGQLESGRKAASPGMKYKHYSPNAEVFLVDGNSDKFNAYANAFAENNACAVVFDGENPPEIPYYIYGKTHEEQAAKIFGILREIDENGFAKAFIMLPDTGGEGLAVYNRLIRAAAFKIVHL